MRAIKTAIFAVVFLSAALAEGKPLTCEEIRVQLRPGDLLFMGMDSKLFKEVARATLTWVAHTGLVLQDDAGGWVVYESKVPLSTRTELCAFLARAPAGFVAAARWPGLAPSDLPILKAEAEKRLGILYQQHFDYDSKLQFCSKFVHDIFAQVPGAPEMGHIETFAEIMTRAERELPAEDYAETKSFFESWFGGSIPMAQRTVTPGAVFADSDLQMIFDRQDPAN